MAGVVLRPGDAIGPYRYERPIGTGGMAHVLLGTDPGGQPIALKVLKAARFRTGLSRFRREFRALARLNHKNVIRVDAYGDIYGHPYIAMEYVEGQDLHTLMRKWKRKPPEERWPLVERALGDMCEALAYIHQRGLIHRDLKPSNILMGPDGVAKLTDFGIVKDLDPNSDPFVSATLVGTWAYASPEQIMGRPLDHRSDLYSLGILLYAMLVGRRPFVAKDMAGYLRLHRDEQPVPPSEKAPDVPPLLEEICLKLLRKQTRDRYQSAQEILLRLRRLDPEASERAGAGGEGDWTPALVGRGEQLDDLRSAVGRLARGEGGVMLIEGDEGTGKSRLLAAAHAQARLLGFPVHTARFAPAQGSFEALLRIAGRIGRELGDQVPPELERALTSFAKGSGRLPGDARYQLYDGVRDALDTLLRDGPLVLSFDDFHHAQGPLVDMLEYVIRAIISRSRLPLLVLATLRPGSTGRAAEVFRRGEELGVTPVWLQVGPFTQAEVLSMVEDMLGKGAAAEVLARRLHEETGGNPFFVEEFLRSLLRRGLIVAVPDGGYDLAADTDEIATGELEIPPGVRRLVDARLEPLDEDTLRLVDTVAVSGREVELELLLDVLDDNDEDAVLGRLDAQVDSGLLVERRAGHQSFVDFRNRAIGEVIYADLDLARRAGLHRRFGAALELRHGASPASAEAIGEHYKRAGESGKGYRYLGQAAERLWERSLVGEAWSVSKRAREIETKARSRLSPGEHASVHLGLLQVQAEATTNMGDWPTARGLLSELVTAAEFRQDKGLWSQASLQLGVVERRLGLDAAGRARIEGVLEQARARHDREVVILALRHMASMSWELGDLDACERYASQGLMMARGDALAGPRAQILTSLSAVQASRGQLAAATSGLSEAETILRGLREKRTRVLVLCNLAELFIWQAELSESLRRADDALDLAEDVVYREGVETALRVRAMARLDLGDVEPAAKDLERSLALAQELGILEDVVATRYLLGRLRYRQGEPDKAIIELRAGLEAARKRDPESYTPALEARLGRVLAVQGRDREAVETLRRVEAAVGDLPLPRRTQVQSLLGVGWMALNEPQRALPVARQAAQVASRRGFRIWALRALQVLVECAPEDEAARARVEATAIARDVIGALTPDQAARFRARPGVLLLLQNPPGGLH